MSKYDSSPCLCKYNLVIRFSNIIDVLMTNINYTLKYFGVCHAGNKINSDFAFVYIIKDMSKRFKDVNIHAVSLDSFFFYIEN